MLAIVFAPRNGREHYCLTLSVSGAVLVGIARGVNGGNLNQRLGQRNQLVAFGVDALQDGVGDLSHDALQSTTKRT